MKCIFCKKQVPKNSGHDLPVRIEFPDLKMPDGSNASRKVLGLKEKVCHRCYMRQVDRVGEAWEEYEYEEKLAELIAEQKARSTIILSGDPDLIDGTGI